MKLVETTLKEATELMDMKLISEFVQKDDGFYRLPIKMYTVLSWTEKGWQEGEDDTEHGVYLSLKQAKEKAGLIIGKYHDRIVDIYGYKDVNDTQPYSRETLKWDDGVYSKGVEIL